MLNDRILVMLNNHLPKELLAHHAYARMELDARRAGLYGIADYFGAASLEERGHMMTMLNLLNDYDFPCTIPSVPPMQPGTMNPNEMFARALEMESAVSESLNAILAGAIEVQDGQAQQFLLGFLDEQTKSEREIMDLQRRLKLSATLAEFDAYMAEQGD